MTSVKVSSYANLNQALQGAAQTFGDSGGELILDRDTTLVAPGAYPGHNLSVRGEGSTKVRPTFADGDYLTFGRLDGGEIRNLLLADFVLEPPAQRDGGGAGWAVKVIKGVRTTVRNVDLGLPETARHDNGFWFDGFDDTAVDNVKVYARWRCLMANGRGDQSYGADLYVGGGSKMQNYKRPDRSDWVKGSAILHFGGGAGGFEVSSGDFIFGGVGLLVDTAIAGAQNREIFLNGPWFDSCAEDGIRLAERACGTLQTLGLWSCSNGTAGTGGCGLRVAPNQVPGFEGILSGARIFNNQGDGAALNGGSWAINGGSYTDNRGWGIGFHNAQAGGIVAGNNIGRNGNKGVRQIAAGQAILATNRVW